MNEAADAAARRNFSPAAKTSLRRFREEVTARLPPDIARSRDRDLSLGSDDGLEL